MGVPDRFYPSKPLKQVNDIHETSRYNYLDTSLVVAYDGVSLWSWLDSRCWSHAELGDDLNCPIQLLLDARLYRV